VVPAVATFDFITDIAILPTSVFFIAFMTPITDSQSVTLHNLLKKYLISNATLDRTRSHKHAPQGEQDTPAYTLIEDNGQVFCFGDSIAWSHDNTATIDCTSQ
jgi:hypothetical protein